MKCTILTVGTEILFGQIVNTNAVFLSQELQKLGIDVMYHMTVGDNAARLRETMDHAYQDCDLIIATGGLGPTQDDLTKENIAAYFGDKIIEFPEEIKRLHDWFEGRGRKMTPNNLKQGCFPEHATILPNPNGTAPGFRLEKNGKIVYSLPGPPKEMQPMFLDYVKPDLEKAGNGRLYYRLVRTLGIGESQLETALLDLIDGQTDPTLATYASQFETTLRIASKRATLEEAERAVDEMLVKVREKVGQYIYSDDNEELADVVLDYLLERGLKLSCAESCTGGSFAKRVTDRPGISAVFDRGFVTYSNEAKTEELGVKRETLDSFGAVSPETAKEMAEGVYRKTGSDICISVTGIAGPDGGSEKKPVGLFYVGLCFRGEVSAYEFRTMRPRRDNVRNYAVREMFATIYRNVIKPEDK